MLFLARFNKKLASTSADSFVEDILYKNLGVAHVVTGYNFAFGKGRQRQYGAARQRGQEARLRLYGGAAGER